MHLKARRNITARIEDLGLSVEIKEGESIHTEISTKFSRTRAQRLFQGAGLSVSKWITDPKGWLSLVELEANAMGAGFGGSRSFRWSCFRYSLLPIVRSTHSGLKNIPLDLRESAEVLGLPCRNRLWMIELRLASLTILSGIKTSAVINPDTAMLGALIGAGGYEQPIRTGIASTIWRSSWKGPSLLQGWLWPRREFSTSLGVTSCRRGYD
jgi:hypothetical protein